MGKHSTPDSTPAAAPTPGRRAKHAAPAGSDVPARGSKATVKGASRLRIPIWLGGRR